MDVVMPSSSSVNLASSLLYVEFAVSFVVVALLIRSSFSVRKLRERLRKQREENRSLKSEAEERISLIEYLDRESEATATRLKSLPKGGDEANRIARLFAQIRYKWLQSEKEALRSEGLSNSDYDYISSGFYPHLQRLVSQVPVLRAQHQRQVGMLKERVAKLNALVDERREESPPVSLELVSSGDDAQSSVVENESSSELENTQQQEQKQGGFLDYVNSVVERSNAECQRLQRANSRQRSLILKLESDLKALNSEETTVSEDSVALQMKQIKTDLEIADEALIELRSQSTALNLHVDQLLSEEEPEEETICPSCGGIQAELDAIASQRRDYLRLIRFVSRVGEAEDKSDLLPILLEVMREHAHYGVGVVRGFHEDIWLATVDEPSESMKQLVTGPLPNGISINDASIRLNLSHCRVLLNIYDKEAEIDSPVALEALFTVINEGFARLAAIENRERHKNYIGELIETTQTSIVNVENFHDTLATRSARSGQLFTQELDQLVDTLELSQAQNAYLHEIAQDYQQQIALLVESGKSLDRVYFDEVLKSLKGEFETLS